MKITLLNYTPLHIASIAIRKCWNSEDKSDSTIHKIDYALDDPADFYLDGTITTGPKNKTLIDRVGNKNKHKSVLEILQYVFDIKDISTSCLLQLTRHRTFSYAVQSTRYTTKKRRDELSVSYSLNPSVNDAIDKIMDIVKEEIDKGANNDDLKLLLPQAYNYSLVLRCDGRNLQNFLSLRTNKSSHYHIRDLANAIYNNLPEDHKYLFTDFIYKKEK